MHHQFLAALAHYYHQQYDTSLSDCCFVFPSRRAGIFFRNHLAQLSEKPTWSPDILTINEFTEQLVQLPVADNITLLFKLYEAYAKVNEQPLSFDDFLPWGEMLLSDFDDIDKYLVDAKLLFSNIMALKEMEGDFTFLTEEQVAAIRMFWSTFNPQKLSEHQQSFLKNWETLYPVYQQFNALLSADQMAYTGMVMRHLATLIKSRDLPVLPWKKVVFAGFFVLTPSEFELFKYLKEQQLAEFYWDYSPWLMDKNSQGGQLNNNALPFRDAASFLRDNLTAFPSPFDWEQPMNTQYPETDIVGVASQTEQLRLVGDFLEGLSGQTNDDAMLNTAVVLTDENMLIPVLHAVPPAFDKINVTLGYPLKNTPIYSLVGAIVQLQRNAKTTRDGKTWFYFRDVLPVLQHQYVSSIDSENAQAIKKKMLLKNRIYVEASELCVGSYFPSIFRKISQSEQIPEYIEAIIFSTYRLVKEGTQSFFEQEFAFALYKSVVKLRDLLMKLDKDIQPDTWLKLFKKLTETQTVPFKGEPLSGLQVMGVMETRAIDFDNLVILNMNEGVFPKDSAPNTFIPFNLRKGFGLPTLEHQDAIFSYYFFRLIHRAKRLRLVYNSTAQGTQSGEMSRYLYQLIYQHPLSPQLKTAVETVTLYKMPQVIGQKTGEVMEALKAMAASPEKALSPSALSSYLECEMRFFYRYINKIKEPEEISESLDMRMFGILLHNTMDKLYQPFKESGLMLSAHDLDALAKNQALIDSTLKEVFLEEFSELSLRHDDFSELQGKNILVFEVLRKFIRQIILNDKEALPLRIVDLEGKYTMPIALNDGTVIHIGGIIDRVDETNSTLRVLDYKTGKAKNEVGKLEHLFNPDRHNDVKAIFQTLLYTYVLSDNHYPNRTIEPAVLKLNDLFQSSDYKLTIGERTNKTKLVLNDVADEFGDRLRELLSRLYDPSVPFAQTDDRKKCDYCAYKGLCNR